MRKLNQKTPNDNKVYLSGSHYTSNKLSIIPIWLSSNLYQFNELSQYIQITEGLSFMTFECCIQPIPKYLKCLDILCARNNLIQVEQIKWFVASWTNLRTVHRKQLQYGTFILNIRLKLNISFKKFSTFHQTNNFLCLEKHLESVSATWGQQWISLIMLIIIWMDILHLKT